MELMKIRDSYMFREKNSDKKKGRNAAHWYFVYDRHKPVYVKELTHLYKADSERCRQLKEGTLSKVKISGFEAPSGMYEAKFKNAENNPLSMRKIKKNTIQEKPKFSYRRIQSRKK